MELLFCGKRENGRYGVYPVPDRGRDARSECEYVYIIGFIAGAILAIVGALDNKKTLWAGITRAPAGTAG